MRRVKWDHPEHPGIRYVNQRCGCLYPPKVSAVSGKPHAFQEGRTAYQFDKLSYWVVWGDGYRGHREAERGQMTLYKRRGGSYPGEGAFYRRRDERGGSWSEGQCGYRFQETDWEDLKMGIVKGEEANMRSEA